MGRDLDALLATAVGDPVHRQAFMDALLASEVLVLGVVSEDGGSLSLVAFDDRDGRFTPFFTSERALAATLSARAGTDPRYLRLGCRALFEMTAGSRLVLNPHGPNGKALFPHEIASLLAGEELALNTETVPAGRTIKVGAAAHVPPELPEVLARFFAQRPVVDAAHLGWFAHPDGREGYLVVVTAGDADQAMHGFGTLPIRDLAGGPTLDVMVVDSPADNLLARWAEPFYIRPR